MDWKREVIVNVDKLSDPLIKATHNTLLQQKLRVGNNLKIPHLKKILELLKVIIVWLETKD